MVDQADIIEQTGAQLGAWRSQLPELVRIDSQYLLQMATSEKGLTEVRASGRIFRLNRPLSVTRFSENGMCYCEYKPLAITSFGRSYALAMQAFHEDFAALWDAIAEVGDDALTGDAIEVKKEFRNLVQSIVAE